MQRSRCIRIARGNDRMLLIVSDRRLAGIMLSCLAAQSKNSEMEMPMKNASTKLALLVLGAASLNAALTPAALAQAKPSTSQTCDNKSTARDDVKRPDARCVNVTSEKYTDERAQKPQGSSGVVKELGPGERWSPLGAGGPHINYSDINPHINYNSIKGGNGGSGGGRGGTSAR